MRFIFAGKEYRFWFRHQLDKGEFRLPKVRYTECILAEMTGPKEAKELVRDEAICHENDTFNRAVGRKLALARTLKRVSTDKAFRRTAWMAYHNRFEQSKKENA